MWQSAFEINDLELQSFSESFHKKGKSKAYWVPIHERSIYNFNALNVPIKMQQGIWYSFLNYSSSVYCTKIGPNVRMAKMFTKLLKSWNQNNSIYKLEAKFRWIQLGRFEKVYTIYFWISFRRQSPKMNVWQENVNFGIANVNAGMSTFSFNFPGLQPGTACKQAFKLIEGKWPSKRITLARKLTLYVGVHVFASTIWNVTFES